MTTTTAAKRSDAEARVAEDRAVAEQRARAEGDPVLRAELVDQAKDTVTTVTPDGMRASDVHYDKDGRVLVDVSREASWAEQLGALAPGVLDSVIRAVPWAKSGSIETSDASKADEVTITITLSREDPVLRARREAQGK